MLRNWKWAGIALITFLAAALLSGGLVWAKKPPKDPPPDPDPPPSISYSITLLGTLGGTYSMGRGMNNSGHVVGVSETDNPDFPHTVHAFVYASATGMRDVDILCHEHPTDPTIDPNPGWVLGVANDINDAGQIVGAQSYRDDDLDGQLDRGSVAFIYTPGTQTEPPVVEELVGFGASGENPRPMAINDDGDVAGYSKALDGLVHAVVWTAEGDLLDLGTLAGEGTFAWAVNDRDGGGTLQVAGWARTIDGERAWRWTGNILGDGAMNDLGILKETKNRVPRVEGYDMNNLGQMVGFSSVSRSADHAFRYSNGVGMEDLGTLSGDDSEACGINVWGDVVGLAQVKVGGAVSPFVAFVYTDEFGMLELEPLIADLPAELSGQIAPWRINDVGQISGPYSDNFNFSGEAFLLSPLP